MSTSLAIALGASGIPAALIAHELRHRIRLRRRLRATGIEVPIGMKRLG